MWFITDLIERYTNNVAKAFMKLAAMEAEANKRALEALRDRRRRQVTGGGKLLTRPALVDPHSGKPLRAGGDEPAAVHVPAGLEPVRTDQREDPREFLKARIRALTELPMGVRGEVVVKYVEGLLGADREAVAALIDKLGKDKKVRVAELQVIVAAVLDEEPEHRRKAEHVAELRRRLLDPFERRRRAHDEAIALLAAE